VETNTNADTPNMVTVKATHVTPDGELLATFDNGVLLYQDGSLGTQYSLETEHKDGFENIYSESSGTFDVSKEAYDSVQGLIDMLNMAQAAYEENPPQTPEEDDEYLYNSEEANEELDENA